MHVELLCNKDSFPYLTKLFSYAREILLIGLIQEAMDSLIQDRNE